MTPRTRNSVSGATPYLPLITFDTVETETPAVLATSPMVTLPVGCMVMTVACWTDVAGSMSVRLDNGFDNVIDTD
jgi:hypothetical protein